MCPNPLNEGIASTPILTPHPSGFAIAPDGKKIAFRGQLPHSGSRIYLVPATGGEPKAIAPNTDRDQGMPTWSANGKFIAFGDVPPKNGLDDGSNVIHVYDIEREILSDLPGSRGLWTTRWSPDGKYICATTIKNTGPRPENLMLYDVRTKQWRDLPVDHVNDPIWSRDSRFIYFYQYNGLGGWWFGRISVSDGRFEKLGDLNGTLANSRVTGWLGLTPDGEVIMLRNVRNNEIYSLDVDWP